MKKTISIEIEATNSIDLQAKSKKIQELAGLSETDLQLIHELATTPKYLKALKKYEKTLRNLPIIL